MLTITKNILSPMKQAKTFLDKARKDLIGFFPVAPQNKHIETHLPENIADNHCLVATKRGLFFLGNDKLIKLLSGEFYGLTTDGTFWYGFQKLGFRGRIVRFSIHDNYLADPVQLVSNLSVGCHQIDFLDEHLYVTDTYNNGLLVFAVTPEGLTLKNSYFPEGKLKNKRKSNNYVHLNSIWRLGNDIYLFFHNETNKTNRFSEIVHLNHDFTIARRIETKASNGHNVVLYRGRFLICDSGDGTLKWGQESVFKCTEFTRGLSITDNYIIVGGSDYGQRTDREKLKGKIYFLDHEFNLISSTSIPGMVQEIRTLNHTDYSLSNSCNGGRYPFAYRQC